MATLYVNVVDDPYLCRDEKVFTWHISRHAQFLVLVVSCCLQCIDMTVPCYKMALLTNSFVFQLFQSMPRPMTGMSVYGVHY